VAAIAALVLALVGTALVAVPETRLIGLGAVLVLAVPLVLIWRRERGSRGFVLATSALAVLFLAFLVGFVLVLVSGVPQRSLFGTSSSAPAPAAPAPPELSPGTVGPPTTAPEPIPDAVPPAAQLPPAAPVPAPAAPQAPAEPAAPATPAAPAEPTGKQSAGSGRDRDDDSQRERSSTERRHATTPSPAPRIGQHCEVGDWGRGPDGSTLFCGQPDGRGDFTWRRADNNGPAPGPGGYGGFFGRW
jgi:hypothetical protein